MKTICLNVQDCGYSKTIPTLKFGEIDLSQPFSKCPLCGYYAITTSKPIAEAIDLNMYKKIYKQIRKNE